MIDRVGRVAVPVGDQDRAIEFYVEKLGFSEVSHMGDPVPPMVWFRDQDGNTLLLVEERPGR